MFPFPFSFLSTQETGLDLLDNVYSMSFDGVDESLVVNNSSITQFPRNEPYSVSFWVKASTYICKFSNCIKNAV